MDTLTDSLGHHASTITDVQVFAGSNVWFYVALAELFVILFLLLFLFRKDKEKLSQKQQLKNELKASGDVDFRNIINSSFHATELYDQLKVKCHPDRFPNDVEKNRIAEALFQEITKNKTNMKKLLDLKEEAIQNLDINF